MNENEIEIVMFRDKECKHSVRFATNDEQAPVRNVYVNRTVPGVDKTKFVTVRVAIGQ